jgi:hypothetical protein
MLGADSTSGPRFIIYRGTATFTARSVQGLLPHLGGPLCEQIGLLGALRPHERVLALLQLLGGEQRVDPTLQATRSRRSSNSQALALLRLDFGAARESQRFVAPSPSLPPAG